MKVEVDSSGVGSLLANLELLSDNAQEALMQTCKQCAEDITATAKGLVYQDGLHYRDGAIRDSLHRYTAETDSGDIVFGVETNLEIAVYHEMGTGPVGAAAGYPGAGLLDEPVVYTSQPWHGNHGVPPKAFMHNALMQEKESAEKAIHSKVQELMP